MWHRVTVLAVSLSILSYTVQSISQIEPTESFCRTLLAPGCDIHLAGPESTRPFKIRAYWYQPRLLLILLGCGDTKSYIKRGVAQVKSNGIPFGTFKPDEDFPFDTVDCPPGKKNTAYSFTDSEQKAIGFIWARPEDDTWNNVTIHASGYQSNQSFWVKHARLPKHDPTIKKITSAEEKKITGPMYSNNYFVF